MSIRQEIPRLFAEHVPHLSVEWELHPVTSGEVIQAFVQAQAFIDAFADCWQVIERWGQHPNASVGLVYYTEEMEEAGFEMVGRSQDEVYQYLRAYPPAGTIVPEQPPAPFEEHQDAPPQLELTFMR